MRRSTTTLDLLLLGCLAACLAACPELTEPFPYAVVLADDDDTAIDDDDSVADDDDAVGDCDLSWIAFTDEEVSLSQTLEPMFFNHCSNCHVPYALGGLTLSPGQSWGALVDAPNMLGYDQAMPRVTPGDPTASYLIHKVVRCGMDDPDWGHFQGPMPPDLPDTLPLSAEQVGWLWAWVEQGAANN